MNNNLFLAIILSFGILLGFQYFYVKPQQEVAHAQMVAAQAAAQQKAAQQAAGGQSGAASSPSLAASTGTLRNRADIIKEQKRISVSTPELSGSIDLQGARFDDLALTRYRETEDKDSPAITLLSPSGSAAPYPAYYAQFSWLAGGSDKVDMPNERSIWTSDGSPLTPDHPVKLTWTNGQGLKIERTVAVDENVMFTVSDHVINTGSAALSLYPFGVVARQGVPPAAGRVVVHEGALGVLNGKLDEYKYRKLADDGRESEDSIGGWLGITDKYWLVAMIPAHNEKISADFAYDRAGATDPAQGFFQSDFRGAALTVPVGGSVDWSTHLFAGAKRIKLLDKYAEEYNIPRFDRAIDFGWFYFLTRPFLYMLALLAGAVHSIGLSILLFTVLLKLATLPLSLKSYHSMSRMKALQPELKRIQERFADDRMRQSQEMMELYKREKVSPMSGCVPTLIQIPIFFALYKVLYVNIEMRQAPFFGWIKDMSVPDPTSWANLFGLAPWDIPHQLAINLGLFTAYLPPAMHVGAWPMLMGVSMFLQQRLSPQPPDKSQAQVFMVMPFVFTYMLSSMPAGLVIYWTWSNLIGIAQQWFIMSRDAARKAGAMTR
jgi:YidC/Oxa1 family membrane protein insertase